jgi:AcrR family transcriptional regulator
MDCDWPNERLSFKMEIIPEFDPLAAKTTRPAVNPSRLDAAAWTEVAIEVLAIQGIDGVRVEVLAKRLKATKGSFYWHFKSRDDLYKSMLDHWRRRATLALIERLDKGEGTADARFRRLMRVPLLGRGSPHGAQVELAIRMWSRRDENAAAALAEVDELRLNYISGLLRGCRCPDREIEARAILAYSYMRVASTLIRPQASALMTICEDLLLGR